MNKAIHNPKVRGALARWLRDHGWAYDVPRDGLRRRFYCITIANHPWWDWGHWLMILVGSDFGGNWSDPKPPTWWYRPCATKRMWRTGYPRRRFQIVTDYDEFRRLTEGLNEDQRYEWKAIYVNQDGELELGHRYWGQNFYGLPHDEMPLLARYIRKWRGLSWFGARNWLYSQGLHAAGGHGGARKPQTPRARLLGAISHLSACDPNDVAASCANADQAQSLDRMILDVAKRLQATRAALKARW